MSDKRCVFWRWRPKRDGRMIISSSDDDDEDELSK